jgi:hypothetical protein
MLNTRAPHLAPALFLDVRYLSPPATRRLIIFRQVVAHEGDADLPMTE